MTEAAADINADRPDRLDSTYSAFHDARCPVAWWDKGGYWFVAGYDAVVAAAGDDETFSSRHDIPSGSSAYLGVMVPPTPIGANPVEVDPPDHTASRRLFAGRLKPGAVRQFEPAVRQIVTWCIDRRIASGRIDLFHDLAKLVPAITTLVLLGLPAEDAEVIADAVHVRGEERFALSPVWTHTVALVIETMISRRREPREDIISDLVATRPDGSRVPEKTVLAICLTMIIGGMSTTAKGALGGLWHIGSVPAHRDQILADPDSLGPAVEEFLRFFSPVPLLARTASADTRLGPASIAQHERVVLGWGAANRDPAVFECPNEIDISRHPNRHVAMGHGAHFCVGASLGRLELSLIIGEALRRMPDFRLDDNLVLAHHLTVRPQPLPATFTPGEPEGRPDAFRLNEATLTP
jgi:cytochrome P450